MADGPLMRCYQVGMARYGASRLAGFLLALASASIVVVPPAGSQASPTSPDYVRIVGNQSSRDGSRPELIVIHCTFDPRSGSVPVVRNEPGLDDLRRLGAWFDRSQPEVSSHVANDAEGNDARYVQDGRAAWTQAAYNPVSLSVEQIGSAGLGRAAWLGSRMPQLEDTARWIAHWHREWNIPIRRAELVDGIITRAGVATHAQLGIPGGAHHDPGAGYPLGRVLELARLDDLLSGAGAEVEPASR